MPVNAEVGRSEPEPQSGAGADGSAGQVAVAGLSPAASGAVSLRVVGLTLGFGDQAILSSVPADVRPGAVTALVGPAGSGKSMLLRTLNRMNYKVSGYRHAGDVLDRRSIWHPAVELMSLRRRAGLVFQRPNPFPMSIMGNVTAGPRAHKVAHRQELKEIARRRLTEVGLWEAVAGRLGDSPFRLSGGQQLLCLARALAISPQVLLLDEPTSSLDPAAAEAIETLIRALVLSLTVVIVTHNLAQARRVSDRTMFVCHGRLVEYGDTAQVFENPAQQETAHYVAGRYG